MDAPRGESGHSLFSGPCGSLLSATREAIVIVDEAQTIVAMNPAAEALLGYRLQDVLGTSVARFVPPPWRDAHAAQVRAFAALPARQAKMARGRRVEALRSDGTRVPVEVALSPIDIVEQGAPRTLYAALMRDASEEQVLEERLVALERRMRAVFELSPIAIWVCEDDRLVYANRAAARLFAVESIDALVGHRVWSLLDASSHEPLRQELDRTLAGQTAGAIVAGRLVRPDGEWRDVEIALAALPDHGLRNVQMVVNDVTQRRREADELERSRRALRELSANVVEAREEERRRISRELHDELGQRLTALKIELANLAIQDRLADDDPRVASMQAMLDDTLASVRRIASDLRPLMLDDLGLNAAIEWLARDAAQRMGIEVRTRLPVSEPVIGRRAATALYRAVQEALTNVARHAQARMVEVTLHERGHALDLIVIDDGIGLDDDALLRAGSFGLLGLRERAHALGGQFDVKRRPEGGTRLSMRVPLGPGEPAP